MNFYFLKYLTGYFILALICLSGWSTFLFAQDASVINENGGAKENAEKKETTDINKPHYQSAGKCVSCHNDPALLQIFRTPHGQGADSRTQFAEKQCKTCHQSEQAHGDRRKMTALPAPGHQVVLKFYRDNSDSAKQKDAPCLGCHQRNSTHVMWQDSKHQRAEVACVDCHQLHPAKDPALDKTRQFEQCKSCHKKQSNDFRKANTHPVRQGSMGCSDCHNPHDSTYKNALTYSRESDLCWSCHAALRGPFLFEHQPVTEKCTLCHSAHGSIHTGMLTRRAPLLCQSCHSSRGHPSLSLTPDSLPGRRPSPFVLSQSCLNCHAQIHGSNHSSGGVLTH